MKFTIAVGVIAAAASCASAFVVPAGPVRGMAPVAARSTVTRVNAGGKYDGKLWDDEAKKDVASQYDASQPRSETNFDPFEKASVHIACPWLPVLVLPSPWDRSIDVIRVSSVMIHPRFRLSTPAKLTFQMSMWYAHCHVR